MVNIDINEDWIVVVKIFKIIGSQSGVPFILVYRFIVKKKKSD